MGWWRKKQPEPPAPDPQPDPVAALPSLSDLSSLERAVPDDTRVVFCSDGVHYPVLFDDNGDEIGPDRSRPLRWDPGARYGRAGFYFLAAPEDPKHEHVFQSRSVDIVPVTD